MPQFKFLKVKGSKIKFTSQNLIQLERMSTHATRFLSVHNLFRQNSTQSISKAFFIIIVKETSPKSLTFLKEICPFPSQVLGTREHYVQMKIFTERKKN